MPDLIINCTVRQAVGGLRLTKSDEPSLDNVSVPFDPNVSLAELSQLFPKVNLKALTSVELTRARIITVPDCISELNLTELILSHNCIREVPDCIKWKLPNLTSLDLSFNKIQDFNFKPKCSLRLRELILCHNAIKNFPFTLLWCCPQLRELDLSVNPFDASFVPLQHRIPENLSILNVANCNLSNKYDQYLREIPKLECLSVNNCKTVKSGCNTITQLNFTSYKSTITLLELNLSGLGLPVFNEEILALKALRKLDLSNNYVMYFPKNLSCLGQLRSLNVSENELLFVPDSIGALNELDELFLANNLISSLPECLAHLPLRVLDLYNNNLTQKDMEIINQIATVQMADFDQNYADTTDLVQYPVQREKYLSTYINDWRLSGLKIEVKYDEPYESASSDSVDCESEESIVYEAQEDNWKLDDSSDSDDYDYLQLCTFSELSNGNNESKCLLNNYHREDINIFEDALDDPS